MAGRCDQIDVTIHTDNSVTVVDNGSGIPVGPHSTVIGMDTLDVVMTKLHAGGKFESNAYKVSGGLHGVGVTCVNALSEWLKVEVYREGKVFAQRYERGHPAGKVTVIGETHQARHPGHLPPRLPALRGQGVLLRDPLRTPARARLPEPRPPHHRRGRAQRKEARVPLQGRHPRVRRLPEQEPADALRPAHQAAPGDGHRERRGLGRHRAAVERRLRREGLRLRQQHPQPRGRHAPGRLQGRAHPHAQRLRHEEQPLQGPQGGDAVGRRHARGSRRRHLHPASRRRLRGADQDQARPTPRSSRSSRPW